MCATCYANYTNLNTNLINQTLKPQLKYPMVWLGVRGCSLVGRMSHLSTMLIKKRWIIWSSGHENEKKKKWICAVKKKTTTHKYHQQVPCCSITTTNTSWSIFILWNLMTAGLCCWTAQLKKSNTPPGGVRDGEWNRALIDLCARNCQHCWLSPPQQCAALAKEWDKELTRSHI